VRVAVVDVDVLTAEMESWSSVLELVEVALPVVAATAEVTAGVGCGLTVSLLLLLLSASSFFLGSLSHTQMVTTK